MDNPFPFHNFLEIFAMRGMLIITLSIMTTISSFEVETRRTIFFSCWTSLNHIDGEDRQYVKHDGPACEQLAILF